jgi:hypothetical protein
VQAPGRLARSDGSGDFEKDVAGIEAFVHLHDGDTCFAISRQDCGMNRRSAAVAWQKRGMDVDASNGGNERTALAEFDRMPRQQHLVSR